MTFIYFGSPEQFRWVRARAAYSGKEKSLERDLAPGPCLVSNWVSLDGSGRGSLIQEKKKSLERDLAPGPCLVAEMERFELSRVV